VVISTSGGHRSALGAEGDTTNFLAMSLKAFKRFATGRVPGTNDARRRTNDQSYSTIVKRQRRDISLRNAADDLVTARVPDPDTFVRPVCNSFVSWRASECSNDGAIACQQFFGWATGSIPERELRPGRNRDLLPARPQYDAGQYSVSCQRRLDEVIGNFFFPDFDVSKSTAQGEPSPFIVSRHPNETELWYLWITVTLDERPIRHFQVGNGSQPSSRGDCIDAVAVQEVTGSVTVG
jgi:hypothetical protein